MSSKTIIHVIYNLGRGGAETLLVQVLKQLKEYRNIVVTLSPENHFGDELECDELICLNRPSLLALPMAVNDLRKIIKAKKPVIVHSQLPLSNFVARLATPSRIPLVTTIQNSISHSKDYKRFHIRTLDRITYHFRKSIIIGVSQNALDDYFKVLSLPPGENFLLYNPVDISRYRSLPQKVETNMFRLVCVCSLSVQKNLPYLVAAFEALKGQPVELHIYGQGSLQGSLQALVDQLQVNIKFKGQVSNIHELLPQYDAYVMSSLYEGLSLSVLEAMSARLPLLLSDIPSFREQCDAAALYFSLTDKNDFAEKLNLLRSNKELREQLAAKAYARVLENFTLDKHMAGLRRIYKSAVENHN